MNEENERLKKEKFALEAQIKELTEKHVVEVGFKNKEYDGESARIKHTYKIEIVAIEEETRESLAKRDEEVQPLQVSLQPTIKKKDEEVAKAKEKTKNKRVVEVHT